MSDERDDESPAPQPDREGGFEKPGPGKGGPRFGPVGGESGEGIELEPGRITGEPIAADGEVATGSEWPERDEWALPRTYGVDTVVALVRDPWWVFVYWELAPETRAKTRERAGPDPRFVLRMLEVGGAEAVLAEVDVPDIEAGDWYVQVTAPRLRIRAELGFVGADGVFHSVFGSDEVPVPAFEPTPPVQEHEEVVPGEPMPEAPPPPADVLFDYSGGREMRDPRHWRRMRMRPMVWKRRKFGGWWSARGDSGSGSGSGSGMGISMTMRMGPLQPEYEKPPGSEMPTSPSSPSSPFGAYSSPGSSFGGPRKGDS